jgi:hypothetical protein
MKGISSVDNSIFDDIFNKKANEFATLTKLLF